MFLPPASTLPYCFMPFVFMKCFVPISDLFMPLYSEQTIGSRKMVDQVHMMLIGMDIRVGLEWGYTLDWSRDTRGIELGIHMELEW